jgi:hypothetical protein
MLNLISAFEVKLYVDNGHEGTAPGVPTYFLVRSVLLTV